jgi:hypothetical protein
MTIMLPSSARRMSLGRYVAADEKKEKEKRSNDKSMMNQ